VPDAMRIVADEQAIAAAVRRLAGEIGGAFPDPTRCVAVVVLEGARRFAEDLLAALPFRPPVAFVSASSYREGIRSSGRVVLEGLDDLEVAGRDVLVIDDILDTGRTLSALKAALRERGARAVKVCVLLEKVKPRAAAVEADFVGRKVPDRFVVGYGLDRAGRFRDLPFVAALPAPGGTRMTRRERLMASVAGHPVDRPPVCFYEINGLDEDPDDRDPFNIYNDPSWRPVIELARERTDRIVMRGVPLVNTPPDPLAERTSVETREENGGLIRITTIRAGRRTLRRVTRRDPDVNTTWTLEPLLKDVDDAKAWLDLPAPEPGGEPDVSGVLATEEALGETGIVSLETGDPLCAVAPLFEMGTYLVIALTEPALFHRMLERAAARILYRVEAVARALPGRLWRIYGPEYASPPYLPPRLFAEYVTRYDTPICGAIARHGGFPRIHSHGRLRDILEAIAATGCTGLDPIEPPPQGDVTLAYVRRRYGRQLTLFGNLEASDLENLPAPQFAEKVRTALREGTEGEGRGFILQPSACPYGRVLAPRVVENYRTMVDLVERF